MKRLLTALVLGCAGPVFAQNPTPPENMVFVPAGEFTKGTNGSDRQSPNTPYVSDDARPQHQATTGAFFIDKTEVTNSQYKKYCDATNYPVPPYWKDGTYPDNRAEHPVTHITYYEAAAYAAWVGKRLPTESEWEKAARGTDGRRFPWGDGFDRGKLIVGESTAPVGQRASGASPYGALDMAGNVFEWTSSWFEPYPKHSAGRPIPGFGQTLKVVRGGCFMSYDNDNSTWFRAVSKPSSRTEFVGFRCAKDAGQ